jgi:hypothetical protein
MHSFQKALAKFSKDPLAESIKDNSLFIKSLFYPFFFFKKKNALFFSPYNFGAVYVKYVMCFKDKYCISIKHRSVIIRWYRNLDLAQVTYQDRLVTEEQVLVLIV